MIKAQDALEARIFDYLEGNLSAEEKELFERELDQRVELRNEVALWKNTFFSEPFHIVDNLEASLLKNQPKQNWTFFLNSILYFGIMVLLSAGSNTEPADAISYIHYKEVNASPLSNILKQEDCIEKETALKKDRESYLISGLERVKQNESNVERQAKRNVMLPSLRDVTLTEVFMEQITTSPLTLTKRISTRKKNYTKKEIQQLNKRKRQLYERQQEMQFLKGNIPYVVPLDIKNF